MKKEDANVTTPSSAPLPEAEIAESGTKNEAENAALPLGKGGRGCWQKKEEKLPACRAKNADVPRKTPAPQPPPQKMSLFPLKSPARPL